MYAHMRRYLTKAEVIEVCSYKRTIRTIVPKFAGGRRRKEAKRCRRIDAYIETKGEKCSEMMLRLYWLIAI